MGINNMTENHTGISASNGLQPDAVNHPSHYQGKIECIEAIRAALGDEGVILHCRGTAMKYIYRTGKKGSAKEDLEKAVWYLNYAIKILGESL